MTLDRALTSMWGQGIGAEIMGRRKFGPQTGAWPADDWQGWWGAEPPFRTPVFVMSHHPHPTINFDNGTSFRFVAGTPDQVLRLAQEAADGLDVRIGGGPTTVRQFLLAAASMGQPDANVGALCKELGVTRQTLYRHVAPTGVLRDDGKKVLARR